MTTTTTTTPTHTKQDLERAFANAVDEAVERLALLEAQASEEPTAGYTAHLQLGATRFLFSVTLSAGLASELVACMTGLDPDEEDLSDCAEEFANQVCGLAKSALAEAGAPGFEMTVPTSDNDGRPWEGARQYSRATECGGLTWWLSEG